MGRETKRLAGDLANRGQPARNFLCREEREIQPIQFNAAIESFAPTRLAIASNCPPSLRAATRLRARSSRRRCPPSYSGARGDLSAGSRPSSSSLFRRTSAINCRSSGLVPMSANGRMIQEIASTITNTNPIKYRIPKLAIGSSRVVSRGGFSPSLGSVSIASSGMRVGRLAPPFKSCADTSDRTRYVR